jgi:hypothetical protein
VLRKFKELKLNYLLSYNPWLTVIFQKRRVVGGDIIQFIPFVHAFYAFESPMFYSHCNREGNVKIIPFAMGTCQGDPWGGGGTIHLTHLKVLPFITNHFLSCLFPSIVDDSHIIGPFLIELSGYEHFQTKFRAIFLNIQLQKFVAWSPFGLPPNFNTPSKGIKISGVLLGNSTFTSSFIKDVLLKDV